MASQVVDRFARVARDQPSRTVLIGLSEDRSLTCAQLWTEFETVRAALTRAGLTNASLLISMAGNRTGYLSLVLACLDLGIALMPVDRSTPLAETLALVDRWHASALVLSDPPAFDRAHLTVPLPNGTYLALFPTMTPEPSLYAGASVMKLTSGSTGLPKATRTTETHLLEDSARIVEGMDIRPTDTQLGVIPLSHAYGLGNLVMPVLMQGTAIVLRDGFAPAQVLADARAHNIRVFPGVPFMFEHLLTAVAAVAWPTTLGQLISAGARLELETVKAFHARFGRKIHSFYGTSETGGISFDDLDKIGDVQTVGRPLSGVRVRVRDEGRLHVSSNAVAAGYAGLPPLEQEGFVDGGFLTGDLGHVNDHGHVVLTGRVSSFINVAGRKVQPDEVETILREMPDVTEVKVLGVPDPQRGEILAACIASRDTRLRALDVRRFCAMRLAAHKVPRVYVFFEELPRDERGKTSRRVLEEAIAHELAAE
jgi:long-chain acyl-CoA synthetase